MDLATVGGTEAADLAEANRPDPSDSSEPLRSRLEPLGELRGRLQDELLGLRAELVTIGRELSPALKQARSLNDYLRALEGVISGEPVPSPQVAAVLQRQGWPFSPAPSPETEASQSDGFIAAAAAAVSALQRDDRDAMVAWSERVRAKVPPPDGVDVATRLRSYRRADDDPALRAIVLVFDLAAAVDDHFMPLHRVLGRLTEWHDRVQDSGWAPARAETDPRAPEPILSIAPDMVDAEIRRAESLASAAQQLSGRLSIDVRVQAEKARYAAIVDALELSGDPGAAPITQEMRVVARYTYLRELMGDLAREQRRFGRETSAAGGAVGGSREHDIASRLTDVQREADPLLVAFGDIGVLRQSRALQTCLREGLLTPEARDDLERAIRAGASVAIRDRRLLADGVGATIDDDRREALLPAGVEQEIDEAARDAIPVVIDSIAGAVGDVRVATWIIRANPRLVEQYVVERRAFDGYRAALETAMPWLSRFLARQEGEFDVRLISSYPKLVAFVTSQSGVEAFEREREGWRATLKQQGFDGALAVDVLWYGTYAGGHYVRLSEASLRRTLKGKLKERAGAALDAAHQLRRVGAYVPDVVYFELNQQAPEPYKSVVSAMLHERRKAH